MQKVWHKYGSHTTVVVAAFCVGSHFVVPFFCYRNWDNMHQVQANYEKSNNWKSTETNTTNRMKSTKNVGFPFWASNATHERRWNDRWEPYEFFNQYYFGWWYTLLDVGTMCSQTYNVITSHRDIVQIKRWPTVFLVRLGVWWAVHTQIKRTNERHYLTINKNKFLPFSFV